MKTWEDIVRDRKQRYLAILKGANDVHLGWSACDELRMVLESCVPVVRCRDCIRTRERDEYTGRLWCSIHRDYMEDTYYCADGLRREDGEA